MVLAMFRGDQAVLDEMIKQCLKQSFEYKLKFVDSFKKKDEQN